MVSGAVLCRFPKGKLDFAKQNQPVLGAFLLPLNPFRKSVYGLKKAWGHGWVVVERYISGQKGYKKADTVPVMAEEKEKAHKAWYITLYNKLFGEKYQK
ncbi:hypothetical protein C5S31_04410 [ANME-1 cluster archaeon GoMg2]|nr:hypothetical protein [ANME-1 cluster archaeon GoMg2]